MEICRRAYRKVRNLKSDPDKIKASLVQKGFTLKEIDAVLKEKV